MADIPELYRLNYNIETPEAEAFWASRHKANRAKAIMAFSLDLDNANDNYRRWNYPRQFRKRALLNFCMYVNKPDMKGIPLSPLDSPWWIEMPYREDSACGGGGDVPVTGVTISPKTVSITVGATSQLSASVSPANATNKSVTYKSSDVTIATVSATGLVTALKAGTVTITVTTVDGGKTDTSTVTVAAAGKTYFVKLMDANTNAELPKTNGVYQLSGLSTAANKPLTVQVFETGTTSPISGGGNNFTATGGDASIANILGAGPTSHTATVDFVAAGATTWNINSDAKYNATVGLKITVTGANVDITSMSSASELMGVYDTTVDVKNIALPFHVEPANATIASVKYSMSGDDVTVRGITVDENTGIVTVPAKQVNGDDQTGDNFSVTVTVVDGNGHSFSDTSAYHAYEFSRYVTEGVGGQAVTVGQDYNFQYDTEQKNRWGYTFGNESGSPLHFEATLGAVTITAESNDTTVLTVKSVDKFNVVVHGVKDGGARIITKYNYGGVSGEDSTYVSVNDPALHLTT